MVHVGDRAQECVERTSVQAYERRRRSERGTGGGTVRPVSGLVTRTLRPFVATERSYEADCYVCCVFFLCTGNFRYWRLRVGIQWARNNNNKKKSLFPFNLSNLLLSLLDLWWLD